MNLALCQPWINERSLCDGAAWLVLWRRRSFCNCTTGVAAPADPCFGCLFVSFKQCCCPISSVYVQFVYMSDWLAMQRRPTTVVALSDSVVYELNRDAVVAAVEKSLELRVLMKRRREMEEKMQKEEQMRSGNGTAQDPDGRKRSGVVAAGNGPARFGLSILALLDFVNDHGIDSEQSFADVCREVPICDAIVTFIGAAAYFDQC
eukprot:SAG31_NODE_5612_length_2424_cov_1.301075_2_plen_205_part_00